MSKSIKKRVALVFGFVFILMILALIWYEQKADHAASKSAELSRQFCLEQMDG